MALALSAMAGGSADAQSLSERVNKGLVEVISGRVGGTAAQIVGDLADVIDDGATRRVLPVIGKGSLQNITDLKALRGVDIAILQSDVLAYARDRRLVPGIETVTYIAKLYNDEFHLLTRAEVRSIRDLTGKRVNLGTPGDGTAITGGQVLRLLGINVEATTFDPPVALEKLRSGEIAGLAYVAGKPAPLFLDRRLPQGLRFVSIPATPELLAAYLPAQLTAEDYPGLVPPQEPVDTVAVGAVMAVAPLAPNTERYRNVANFVDAFFTNFPKLQDPPRHSKWQEVNLTAELSGWRRFPPAESWLKQNAVASPAMAETQLREIFGKFLEERTRLTTGAGMAQQRRDELFQEFLRWQQSQRR